MPPLIIKTIGYLISSASVILLGIATWSGIDDKPALLACLVAGMAASIGGMACRWYSYCKEHRAEVARAASAATRKAA
jgi:hypothetical protein